MLRTLACDIKYRMISTITLSQSQKGTVSWQVSGRDKHGWYLC